MGENQREPHVLTTPSLSYPYARATFLAVGAMPMFREEDYRVAGHITLMPWWLLKEHARATGWQMDEHSFAGTLLPRKQWGKAAATAIAAFLGRYRHAGERKFGCLHAILRKE